MNSDIFLPAIIQVHINPISIILLVTIVVLFLSAISDSFDKKIESFVFVVMIGIIVLAFTLLNLGRVILKGVDSSLKKIWNIAQSIIPLYILFVFVSNQLQQP